MTDLTKPVTRRVRSLTGADLIVTLLPEGIEFREPRRRKSFLIPYGEAFVRAARLSVDAELRDKPKRKIRVKRGVLSL
jgi:hypothetical protein